MDKPVPPFSMNVLELDLDDLEPEVPGGRNLKRPYSFLHIKNFSSNPNEIEVRVHLHNDTVNDWLGEGTGPNPFLSFCPY